MTITKDLRDNKLPESELLSILSKSLSFRHGYIEYLKEHNFNYNIANENSSTLYTYGRQFAAWMESNKYPTPVWVKGDLNTHSKIFLKKALISGVFVI